MPYSATDYLQQYKALLPRGKLWDSLRELGKLFGELLHALSEEFARIDASAQQLIEESDPRTVLQLLSEREQFAGLPTSCSSLGATLEQRRYALLTAETGLGGASRPYIISQAVSLGFDDASITEFEPHTVDDTVDAAIYGEDWRFAWQLSATMPDIAQFNVDSTVDESLGEAAATTHLECLLNRIKPGHTTALFQYT